MKTFLEFLNEASINNDTIKEIEKKIKSGKKFDIQIKRKDGKNYNMFFTLNGPYSNPKDELKEFQRNIKKEILNHNSSLFEIVFV